MLYLAAYDHALAAEQSFVVEIDSSHTQCVILWCSLFACHACITFDWIKQAYLQVDCGIQQMHQAVVFSRLLVCRGQKLTRAFSAEHHQKGLCLRKFYQWRQPSATARFGFGSRGKAHYHLSAAIHGCTILAGLLSASTFLTCHTAIQHTSYVW